MAGITFGAERFREIGERYGVARLEVFGSVSRGDSRSDSDIDLPYELKSGARSGFAFFEREDELAELFGCPVDLVARDAVNAHIRHVGDLDADSLHVDELRLESVLWSFTVLAKKQHRCRET